MTSEQLLDTIRYYKDFLDEIKITPKTGDRIKSERFFPELYEVRISSTAFFEDSYENDAAPPNLSQSEALEHVRDMLDRIAPIIEVGKIEKAMRWLGFIQGVLWMCGAFSIEDLKTQNRSK